MGMPFAQLLPRTDRGRELALAGTMLALIGLKLWLVAWHQIAAEGAARYDDLLFVELADHVRQGNWLGPYDERTLVKGAFYPVWLAGVSLLSLPLLPAQQVLRAMAAVVVVATLRPVLPHRGARLALFVALIFDPATFERSAMRVIREGIYPALTMFVFSGLALLVVRPRMKLPAAFVTTLGLGLALACFWLTREEGIWIVPAAALALGYAALRTIRDHASPQRFVQAGAMLIIPAALVALAVGGVAALNRHHYGVACVNEFKAPFFGAAYGALTRVTVPPRHITPVTAAARDKIYAVSPSFAELRPYLDSPKVDDTAKRSSDPYEYFGGMFIWRFRDAVAMLGHADSLPDARAYYLKLAEEVNTACADGRLECGPRRASISPAWENRYAAPLVPTIGECLHILLRLNWVKVEQRASIGPEDTFPLFAEVTNMAVAPIVPDEPRALVRIEILRAIRAIYSVALYPLSLLAAAGLALGVLNAWRQRRISPLLVLAVVALAAIAVRTVLLSYINVSSFPAIYGIYSHPTYPMLYVFIALGLALGVEALSARRVRVSPR